ncbi:glutaredoxin family protein [Alicyclobacillus tolerans]|uniref:glutaredoxin family protein n=1 Tax=Alicyclobacillus tolerans TaxID=90970 RepID=UPI001F318F14|nr:glutaredoxin family protein [Alicyclobacillus tolerans]MCF8566624.1 glutaredoxin family protein [Alicyclobacillus tolerans]
MDFKKNIVLYTHKGCPGGERAISYFHENDIPVQIKDIVNDPDALNEFREHGCFATPVIIIDGKKFVGFDEEEVEQVLGRARLS